MMTDAHADAIEAAALAVVNRRRQIFDLPIIASRQDSRSGDVGALLSAQAAITAYFASMAEAGWVMVRDVPWSEWTPATDGDAPVHSPQFTDGWNACRAAMLADPAPQR